MAVAQMSKFIIASHSSEASDLLENLQQNGICQLLESEQATITRDDPELVVENNKPKDVEQLLSRLENSISFLSGFSEGIKGLEAILAPRIVIDEETYRQAVDDKSIFKIMEHSEEIESAIEQLESQCDHLWVTLEHLCHWEKLDTPVEEIGPTEKASIMAGFIPLQNFEDLKKEIADLGAAIQVVEQTTNRNACIVAALNENLSEVQKALRQADFEQVNFEGMRGLAKNLIAEYKEKIKSAKDGLGEKREQAKNLAENLLKLQILYDHYSNLLVRESTRSESPATEQTVLLEGWVKKENYGTMEAVVSDFGASSLQEMQAEEDENVPIEIENKQLFKPFEVITRLYGMPQRLEVDPTAFLAPFFAVFFGLCLTDAGYGLIILAISIFFIMKMQGDKKLMWMLVICSIATVVAGALMGGWFGDAVQKFVPSLMPLREKMMWFDPMVYPLRFFTLSLILGYIQIMTGLLIAFIYALKRKNFVEAVCDRLSWLVLLNSILLFALAKTGKLPSNLGSMFGITALAAAAVIFLFSQREGSIGARLGMGFYNLFSALFYVGDVLSYLRLMALGLVTAGLAMAVNQISELAKSLPIIGIVVAIIILVGGHLFNLGINALGAFVHTLRLQYAEFFPKFFSGGGLPFNPLDKNYKHIYIKKNKKVQ
ncbi:MAG: V-type ATP synthase subunit I [Planctomycetota bacterium]|jgi:V/A-type H+-transporting ATPase subunit I